ncbi:MAG TPA: iron-sulfur cluster insertion protein ErpA [Sphingobacteriaceae bacterium]|nr:iron-sulfur cluster insertion protein ErpA [Sphingobacteriaceae bacterium]
MITITDAAGEKIKEVMAQRNVEADTVLRLFVQTGGCSGFSYGMALGDSTSENDRIIEQHGIRVAIDPFSAAYLRGVEIDYIEGVMGGGFTIRNPNAVQTCGCGQSFRTAEDAGQAQPCDDDATA